MDVTLEIYPFIQSWNCIIANFIPQRIDTTKDIFKNRKKTQSIPNELKGRVK